MPANPCFELFEVLCAELALQPVQIIPESRVDPQLLEDIKDHLNETDGAVAFRRALSEVDEHITKRGGVVPYVIDMATREFTARDADYIEFVAFAKNQRSVGGVSARDFEVRILRRLRGRLTGDLRRVGVPRTQHTKKKEIVAYLVKLGFEASCFEKRDKDGGLDILWLPPLGAVPMRPIVSLQCKNSYFDEDEANKSTGRAQRTLTRHTHLRSSHLKFVVFNDYIDDSYVGRSAGWSFVPLGVTDLASPVDSGFDEIL